MLRANTMFPNRSALNSGSFSSLLAFWSSATVGLSGSSLSGNRYRLRPFTSEPQSWVRLGKAHHSMVRQTVTCNDCNERWKGHYSTVIGVEQTHLPQPKKSMTCPTSCIKIAFHTSLCQNTTPSSCGSHGAAFEAFTEVQQSDWL